MLSSKFCLLLSSATCEALFYKAFSKNSFIMSRTLCLLTLLINLSDSGMKDSVSRLVSRRCERSKIMSRDSAIPSQNSSMIWYNSPFLYSVKSSLTTMQNDTPRCPCASPTVALKSRCAPCLRAKAIYTPWSLMVNAFSAITISPS